MSLRHTYSLFAPLYDALVGAPTLALRRASLAGLPAALGELQGTTILLAGIGTGLDLAHLPAGPRYLGLDLTPAMLRRARRRSHGGIALQQGDAMAMPYRDGVFDAVLLHLILAVVPEPARLLAEAVRVTRPGGAILVADKFLRPGQRAPLRRLASPLLGRLATRTDVTLEPLLAAHPELVVEEDLPALAGGWFRRIRLRRR